MTNLEELLPVTGSKNLVAQTLVIAGSPIKINPARHIYKFLSSENHNS
jgi:hypothetical protein